MSIVKNNSDIAVIMPVYNRKEVTLECLEYLQQQTKDLIVLVIADNCKDGTQENITKNFGDVYINETKKDFYRTGSMGIGTKFILDKFPDIRYILSFNDDVSIENNYIETIYNIGEQNKDALIGSACFNYYDHLQIFYNHIKVNWEKYQFNHHSIDLESQIIKDNDFLPGRGTLIPRSVFENIGNYNSKKFPHYLGDYDFSYRAKQKGHELIISNGAKVYAKRELTKDIGRNREQLDLSEAYKFITDFTALNLKHNLSFLLEHCPIQELPRGFQSMIGHIYNNTFKKAF